MEVLPTTRSHSWMVESLLAVMICGPVDTCPVRQLQVVLAMSQILITLSAEPVANYSLLGSSVTLLLMISLTSLMIHHHISIWPLLSVCIGAHS